MPHFNESGRQDSPYYADLNPVFGARGEPRWAVFHRKDGICHSFKYKARRGAEIAARRLNKRADESARRQAALGGVPHIKE